MFYPQLKNIGYRILSCYYFIHRGSLEKDIIRGRNKLQNWGHNTIKSRSSMNPTVDKPPMY